MLSIKPYILDLLVLAVGCISLSAKAQRTGKCGSDYSIKEHQHVRFSHYSCCDCPWHSLLAAQWCLFVSVLMLHPSSGDRSENS